MSGLCNCATMSLLNVLWKGVTQYIMHAWNVQTQWNYALQIWYSSLKSCGGTLWYILNAIFLWPAAKWCCCLMVHSWPLKNSLTRTHMHSLSHTHFVVQASDDLWAFWIPRIIYNFVLNWVCECFWPLYVKISSFFFFFVK